MGSDFNIGMLFNPMSMLQGITGGGEDKAQGAAPAKGNSFDQIGDSFKNGDIMGGIGQILGMCTGMSGMGGGMNMTEMMNPMMFMDPLSKKLFEECSKQGYAQSNANATAAPGESPEAAIMKAGLAVVNQCSQTNQKAPSYDQRWASALNTCNKYFDLLDTASATGGKDGLIGRCDLEAAAKNPGLPAELRQACQFLLANPAAFNQLDVGAGLGDCDGLIGKCDVEAALKALPKKAEPAKPNATKADPTHWSTVAGETKTEGKGGTSSTTKTTKTDSKDDAKAEASEADKSSGASGTREASNPYEGLDIEEIFWSVLSDINGDLNDVAKKLKNAKDADEIKEIELEMEKLMQKRKQMYTLISNMNTAEHGMSMTAINSIGQI